MLSLCFTISNRAVFSVDIPNTVTFFTNSSLTFTHCHKQLIILLLSFYDPLHCYTRKRTVSNLLLEFTHHVTQGKDRAQNHLCQVRHIEYHCFLTCFLLQALKITMKKPPDSFKLGEPLKTRNDAVRDEPVVLYDGMQCWLWTKDLI